MSLLQSVVGSNMSCDMCIQHRVDLRQVIRNDRQFKATV